MLIKCPECDLSVSDKAVFCPHCGYLFKPAQISMPKRKNRRRRLPNGFGQISEIKNRNLRKPYRAMVTVGKTELGKPICKPLKPDSYFKTYNEAYEALAEYNKNPYSLDDAISVKDLYSKWSEHYFPTLKSGTSVRTIESAWAYCSEVYDMRASDLRARHIKGVMENGTAEIRGEIHRVSPNIKGRIKSLFNLMLDYALEYEIVDKNYARTFSVSSDIVNDIDDAKRGHIAFSNHEMNLLWSNINEVPWVDALLIQCYMGWRPQELGLLRIDNVDLNKWTIVGGMKTDAGTDRLVPIHSRIRPFIKARIENAINLSSEYLFNCTDTQTHRSSLMLTYEKYRSRFNKIVKQLNLNPEHRAHDGRVQFITMAKKYKVDEYAIKYMAGHHIDDITESIYTKRDPDWLSQEIEKIK